MKLLTYLDKRVAKIGAVVEDRVIDLSGVAPDMISLIELGAEGLAQAQAAVDAATGAAPLSSVQLLAPIPDPRRNVMCLGLNYAEHIAEQTSSGEQADLPEFPIVFTKATTTANGPFDDIVLDPAVTGRLDWEVELAVVISRAGANISREEAMAHVFGYMVLNDVSARDLQWRHKQFFKGKSLDGACPMGPWIITADELGEGNVGFAFY